MIYIRSRENIQGKLCFSLYGLVNKTTQSMRENSFVLAKPKYNVLPTEQLKE
jgi:hypothetical protein